MRIYASICVSLFSCRSDAFASAIALFSQGTNADKTEHNSTGAPTIPIRPHQFWNAALPGSTVVSFIEELFLPWIPTAAWISIMADDSVTFSVNGINVVREALQEGNRYRICSGLATGCRSETALTVQFAAFRRIGDFAITETPEPGPRYIFVVVMMMFFKAGTPRGFDLRKRPSPCDADYRRPSNALLEIATTPVPSVNGTMRCLPPPSH